MAFLLLFLTEVWGGGESRYQHCWDFYNIIYRHARWPFLVCLSVSLYKNCCCNIGRCCRSAFSRIVLRFTHAIACCYRGVGHRQALCHCCWQRCVGRSGGVRGWRRVPVARSSSSGGPAPRRSLGHWPPPRTSYGGPRTSWWNPAVPASLSSSHR